LSLHYPWYYPSPFFNVVQIIRLNHISRKHLLKNVGTEKCQACHKKEFELYAGSDHFPARDTAKAGSVLGYFNNSYYKYFGDTSFFYQHDGQYFVKTKDSTEFIKEFKISFTFGWRPLQQ
jgi:hypothetical protein